jgi:hypothetical protein
VTVVPAPAIVPGRADQHSGTENERSGQGGVEHHGGVIDRYINSLGVRRRNIDDRLAAFFTPRDLLLRRRFEIAGSLGPGAQQLRDGRDVVGLNGESPSKRLGPVDMFGKHLDHVGKARQRLDR